MLMFLFMLCSETAVVDRPLSFTIREHIYMAEVYGQVDDSLAALHLLWLDNEAARPRIARAISIIKGGSGRAQNRLGMDALGDEIAPHAIIRFGIPALLIGDVWLEPGEWIEDYFVLDIEPEALVLERRDGFNRSFALENLQAPVNVTLNQADARDILTFVARRQGLNAFVPSQIRKTVSGDFQVDDWLAFLDDICRQTGMIWIRRSDNVIFNLRGAGDLHAESEMIKSSDRRNQSLNAFLQNIAVTFDLELMLDEDLEDVELDILLTQEQSWDEVLECLSLMNGFSWFVARNTGERSRLVIQKDREE